MRHLALSCLALQSHFCSTSKRAEMDKAEFSDLHLVIPSVFSTGQACLVTAEWVESSPSCTGLGQGSLCQEREQPLERNSQGKAFGWSFPKIASLSLLMTLIGNVYLHQFFFPPPRLKAFYTALAKSQVSTDAQPKAHILT